MKTSTLLINVELLKKTKEGIFWVAYSGGLDSQVLLHQLCNFLPKHRLRAVHINHGWHTDAAQWASLCKKNCLEWGIECEVIQINSQAPSGESLEAYARHARYEALKTFLGPNDSLVTAHHQDDQTETILLQLMRGAGLPGLAGMPNQKDFGQGTLIRPLLHVTRSELLAYAQAHQLTWIEDSSNADIRFSRNFLRHQIVPVLKQRWPSLNKTLTRTGKHMAEAQQLLEDLAEEDIKKAQGPDSNTLQVSCLKQLSFVRLRNCLRYWLYSKNLGLPSQKVLKQIELSIIAKPDANPQIIGKNFQIRRFRDLLFLFMSNRPPASIDASRILWRLNQPLEIPRIGILRMKLVIGKGISCKLIQNEEVEVGFRSGGERYHAQGRLGSRPLKKLFQDWGIPPWQRSTTPLIYYQNKLIAVVGHSVCQQMIAQENEEGYVLELQSAQN